MPHPILDQIATATSSECAAILAAVAARLTVVEPSVTPVNEPPDELIDARTAAAILKVSVSTVQHRAKEAPLKYACVRSLGRGLLFSRRKVEKMIAREAGRDTSEQAIGLRGMNNGRRRRLTMVGEP